MLRLLIPAAFSLALLPGAAVAAMNLNGGYEFTREQETQLPARGFGTGFSLDLGEHFGLGGNYSQLRTDPYDDQGVTGRQEYATFSGSLSATTALRRYLFLSASAGYSTSRTRGLDGFDADPDQWASGPSGSLVLSARTSTNIEMWIGPSYSYVGGLPGWNGFAGIGLRLLKGLWLDAGYWRGEANDGWSLGLRTDIK